MSVRIGSVRIGSAKIGTALFGTMLLAAPAMASAPVRTVSLMTYNVHGLPWPIASDRPAALRAIVAQLRTMRAAGRQPGIVALQEAFVPEAKAIGRAAGYRYAVFGPDADLVSAAPMSMLDRAFAAAGGLFSGERVGRHEDSGLAIFSDYPIVGVQRMSYGVCAGYDCLANKGAVAARILVPGMATPITVVDTHLNSNTAAGVTPARAIYAYRRQLDQFSGFLASAGANVGPLLVAGDFNVGHDPARRTDFAAQMFGGPATLRAAVATCRIAPECPVDQPRGMLESLGRAKDWLMYRSSPAIALQPVGLGAPFGRGIDGTMLSDHVGIMARYRIDPRVVPVTVAVAQARARGANLRNNQAVKEKA